jgi:hypothetical protein
MAKPASTKDRGYSGDHPKERARIKPIVDAGQAMCAEIICLMPNRWIQPGTPWDLAHDRTRPGFYLGPAHRKCNRAEGGRHRALVARARIFGHARRTRSRDW